MAVIHFDRSWDPLARLAARLCPLSGWRRAAVAAAAGAAATLALAPLHFVPALFVSLPLLIWLTDGPVSRRRAFVSAWWFGLGHFTAGLYWIGNAFGVVGQALFAPVAVLLLSSLLALFIAAAVLAARRLRLGVTGFAICWTLAEWLRGHVFTGFPWNLLGYGWAATPAMLQSVSAIGIYGLSFLTVWMAASFAALGRRPYGGAEGWRPPLGALALLAGLALFGWLRIPAGPMPVWPDLNLRLVQANIPQTDKWDEDLRSRNFARHLAMSDEEQGRLPNTFIIWPETAVTYFLDKEPFRRAMIGRLVNPDGYVLTGIDRLAFDRDGQPLIYNSLQAIDGVGDIVGAYDKHHLVPFGEYMPFRGALAAIGLEKLTPGDIDFSAGPGPATLSLPRLPPFSPLICYEAIFPHRVIDKSNRPDWLLNVTNDGWYGISAGPHQHLDQALTRAVEEGLPLVRVAGTGISAVVDPYGRVTGLIPLGQSGVLNAQLPAPLPETIYGAWGDAPLWGIMAVSGLFALFMPRRKNIIKTRLSKND